MAGVSATVRIALTSARNIFIEAWRKRPDSKPSIPKALTIRLPLIDSFSRCDKSAAFAWLCVLAFFRRRESLTTG